MKLSKKQQDEIEILKYFLPEMYKDCVFSDEDIKAYFDASEKGIGEMPEKMKFAKTYREFHIASYRKEFIEIVLGMATKWQHELFYDETTPQVVKDFIDKQLLKIR